MLLLLPILTKVKTKNLYGNQLPLCSVSFTKCVKKLLGFEKFKINNLKFTELPVY